MKAFRLIAALILVATVTAPGEVIDRIVALVNGHVILQSHVEDDVYFEALSDGRPVHGVTDKDRGAALEHLIDQELVREQIQAGENSAPAPEDVQKRIAEIRALHPGTNSDEAWREELARYGLDEKRLEAKVTDELTVLRQIDLRLRPTVQVENREIETYYRDTFVPEMRKVGAAEPPLAEVSSRIREILTQQKISEQFSTWLEALRKESKIRTSLPVDSGTSGGPASK